MSNSYRSLCVSFSRTGAGLCIYHLFVWSNLNFLYISKWITLLTKLSLVLYSFCPNLLLWLIMWLIVSFLSPHSLLLLFCCILSILALIWLVLILLLLFTHYSFSHQRKLVVLQWSLRNSKSPRASNTLLSIQVVFNNAVVWMVSTRPPTSKSSRPFNNPLVNMPKALITNGIILTFMFHSLFFFSIL